MSNNHEQQMLALADAFGEHRNLTHWRVSYLVRGNGMFFKNLREGSGCQMRTWRSVVAWFDAHWPADLAWPDGVPRPSTSERQEVA